MRVLCNSYPCFFYRLDFFHTFGFFQDCFFFSLYFLQFEYYRAMCRILVFILHGILWTSSFWDLVSVIHFGKFLVINISNVSSISFYLFSLSGVSIMYMLNLLKSPQNFGYSALFLVHPCFSLHFGLWSFYWHIFKLTDFFLVCVQSIDEPIKVIFHACYSVLIASIIFWLF